MTKKGPLSKAEKFYIENHRDLELKELCKDLDRAQSTIEKFLSGLPQAEKTTRLYDQFARNEKGSTVMTQNAAEIADELRGKVKQTAKTKSCTTSIR
tara:strand:- start:1248 stop:1538 length:291 start_codon:yes stop_codon:yes gene_type:complete